MSVLGKKMKKAANAPAGAIAVFLDKITNRYYIINRR
jgi:hypothetical protein